jgi:hypothetical protein
MDFLDRQRLLNRKIGSSRIASNPKSSIPEVVTLRE